MAGLSARTSRASDVPGSVSISFALRRILTHVAPTSRTCRGGLRSMEPGELVTSAAQRDLVRRGYDAISVAYRSDGQPACSSAENVSRYAGWIEELVGLLPGKAVVVD